MVWAIWHGGGQSPSAWAFSESSKLKGKVYLQFNIPCIASSGTYHAVIKQENDHPNLDSVPDLAVRHVPLAYLLRNA
jgi:hypothetical protein